MTKWSTPCFNGLLVDFFRVSLLESVCLLDEETWKSFGHIIQSPTLRALLPAVHGYHWLCCEHAVRHTYGTKREGMLALDQRQEELTLSATWTAAWPAGTSPVWYSWGEGGGKWAAPSKENVQEGKDEEKGGWRKSAAKS